MKKLWLLLGAAAIVLLLAACSANSASPSVSPEASFTRQTADNIENEVSPTSQPEASSSPAASPEASAKAAEPAKEDGVTAAPASPSSPPSPSASVKTPTPAAPPAERSPTPKATPKPEEHSSAKATPTVDSVTVSIVGNAEWGTIVSAETVPLANGETAASLLKKTAKAHKLAYEMKGSGELTYVEGIDGLYEFDDGPTSGWKYRVNGKVPDVGAGSYELKPGDKLEWFYTSEDEAAKKAEESTP